jgi:hypothetical protein
MAPAMAARTMRVKMTTAVHKTQEQKQPRLRFLLGWGR